MVIREYICSKCGAFETTTSIKEDVLKECPACGTELKRKFTLTDVLWCQHNKHRHTGINPQPDFKPMLVNNG